jgi:hypothetical protein
MPTTPRELSFGSLFAYSPHGESELARQSQRLCHQLKRDGFTQPRDGGVLSAQPVLRWIAERIADRRRDLPFADFFGADVTLVPMPTHAKQKENSLWVPRRLCDEMCRVNLAGAVSACIVRTTAVPKAAQSRPDERPTVEQHVRSMSVDRTIEEFDDIVLLDDVVTRGATLMAASIKILEAFPRARVRAIAILRTVTDPEDFRSVERPCVGTIKLYDSGKTHREP